MEQLVAFKTYNWKWSEYALLNSDKTLNPHSFKSQRHLTHYNQFSNPNFTSLGPTLKTYPKFPYFLFLTWLSIIRNQEFRLYI